MRCVGRATKGAAAALLTKIYLTSGDKKSAETVLLRIVGTYGYSLLPDYASLWGLTNKIMNAFTNAFSPLLRNSVGAYKNRPTQDMIKAYKPGDDRLKKSMDTTYVNAQGVILTNTKKRCPLYY